MSKEVVALLRSQLQECCPQSPLSFLYQTRTLSTFFKARSCRTSSPKCRSFATSSCLKADHIPFERSGDELKSFNPKNRYDGAPKATITAAERAIFDRIYQEVRGRRADQKKDELPEDKIKRDELDSRLQAMLKPPAPIPSAPPTTRHQASSVEGEPKPKVIGRLPLQFEVPPQEWEEKPPAVASIRFGSLDERRREALLKSQPAAKAQQEAPPLASEKESKDDQLIREARERDMLQVTRALDEADNDAALWDVLEKKVFSKAVRMTQNFDKEKQRANVNFAQSLRSKLNARESFQARLEAKGKDDDAAENPRPLPMSPLTILQTNYAPQLLHAMRLLRAHAPASPHAPTILARMRALGPASSILGATTELYNEAMFLRWRYHLDYHGVAALAHEMLDQGLDANVDTLLLLNAGARWRRDAAAGERGPVERAILRTPDFERGWARWVEGFRRAKRNVVERVKREAEAEEERRLRRRQRRAAQTLEFKRQVRVGDEESSGLEGEGAVGGRWRRLFRGDADDDDEGFREGIRFVRVSNAERPTPLGAELVRKESKGEREEEELGRRRREAEREFLRLVEELDMGHA